MQEETQEEDAGKQNFADVDEDKEETLFPQDNRTAIVETVSRAETTESTLRRRRNASIGRRIPKDTSLEPGFNFIRLYFSSSLFYLFYSNFYWMSKQ